MGFLFFAILAKNIYEFYCPMFKYLFLFFAYFSVLFFVELFQFMQKNLVMPFTDFLATLSALILGFLYHGVFSEGNLIYDQITNQGVYIMPGCNGVEVCLVLVAAILAFPSNIKNKVLGIFFGVLVVQFLNLIRIVSLFFLLQWDKNWFDFFHLYLWQALIMLDALVFWFLWVRYSMRVKVDGAEV